jgi:hypothetical protein
MHLLIVVNVLIRFIAKELFMNKLYGVILASFMLMLGMSGSAQAAITAPANQQFSL